MMQTFARTMMPYVNRHENPDYPTCADCAYQEVGRGDYLCAHPKAALLDVVLGNLVSPRCEHERDDGKCGIDGELFEAKADGR